MEKGDQSARLRDQIAFIACSKRKRRVPGKAREVYQGSLFKKALAYCEARFDKTFILSAKYGLIEPDDFISPYEQTLNRMSQADRKAWVIKVKEQLLEKQIVGFFWFFTGERYSEFFMGEKPLRGLSLGRQLQWFNLQSQEKGFGL